MYEDIICEEGFVGGKIMDNILKFSDLFDAIICICMESEEHKWVNQCVPQFKKLGINVDDVIRHPW